MNDNIIVVCGARRSGVTLLMSMLEASGIKCVGSYPDFDNDKLSIKNQNPQWLIDQKPCAVRILDPLGFRFLKSDYRFIWVNRDYLNNAMSILKVEKVIKLAESDCSIKDASITKDKIRRTAKKLIITKQIILLELRKKYNVFETCFEELILTPKSAAQTVANYLDLSLDVEAMARCVIDRPVTCMLDFNIEIQLLKIQKQRANNTR